MSAHDSLASVHSFLKWLIILSLVGPFLYATRISGLFGLLYIALELGFFLVATGFYLVAGWVWHGWEMIQSGLLVWPAVLSLGLGLFAFALARIRRPESFRRSTDDNAVEDSADASSDRSHRLICLVALLAAWFAGVDLAQNLSTLLTRPIRNSGHRVARQRLESRINLGQIAVAQHNHVESYGQLPSATAKRLDAKPGLELQHSWATMLLPHLDERSLFQEIDLEDRWDAPQNQSAMRTQLPYFLNPAIAPENASHRIPLDSYGAIHYAANRRVASVNTRVRFRDLTDGTSTTMLSGEVTSHWRAWGRPGNWRDARLGINKSPDGFGSPFPGGAHFLQADGAVKFLNDNTDPTVLENFANPRDGNAMPQGF